MSSLTEEQINDLKQYPLIAAIYEDNNDKAKKYFGFFTNYYSEGSKSTKNYPIHIACLKGNLTIVELILKKYEKTVLEISSILNSKNTNEETPIILACKSGNLQLVHFLLDKLADPYQQDHYGDTALHIACREGPLNLVKDVIELRRLRHEYTGILSKKYFANKPNNAGFSPFHLACRHGHHQIVKYLVLQLFNEPNATDRPDEINVWVKFMESADNEYKRTPLISSCLNNDLEMVKILVDNVSVKDLNGSVNLANKDGDTALHIACRQNNTEIAKKLLSRVGVHFDVNKLNKSKRTPLQISVLSGNKDLIDLLINKNADPTILDSNGKTLLLLLEETYEEIKTHLSEYTTNYQPEAATAAAATAAAAAATAAAATAAAATAAAAAAAEKVENALPGQGLGGTRNLTFTKSKIRKRYKFVISHKRNENIRTKSRKRRTHKKRR